MQVEAAFSSIQAAKITVTTTIIDFEIANLLSLLAIIYQDSGIKLVTWN